MSKYLFSVMLILIGCKTYAQVEWGNMNQWEERQKLEVKYSIVFIYTDWCSYCKRMEQTTFKNSKIVERLNKYFHTYKVNAEEMKDIIFQGRKYRLKPTGVNTGIHEWVIEWTKSERENSYPITLIFNSKNEKIIQHNGFISSQEMDELLNEYIEYP